RKARRMNSWSVQDGDGGIRSATSFFNTSSSTKFSRGAAANTCGSTAFASGTVIVAAATKFEYQTVTAASPGPCTLTRPSSSTPATCSSVEEYFAHFVTSSEWPSEYHARTRTCSLSFGLSVAAAGTKYIRSSVASSAP